MNLKPKPTPCHSSLVPPTQRWAQHVHERCSLSSRHLAASQIYCLTAAHFFCSIPPTVSSASHPPAYLSCKHICVSPSLQPAAMILASGLLPLPPCLGSCYPAITQSFPLRGCFMSGVAEPACPLPASPDLRTRSVQPQTPLVCGVAPAMAQSPWKIMQTSERRAAGLAAVLEL